jgi:hypothetical protein
MRECTIRSSEKSRVGTAMNGKQINAVKYVLLTTEQIALNWPEFGFRLGFL